jgi:hypothetical protein
LADRHSWQVILIPKMHSLAMDYLGKTLERVALPTGILAAALSDVIQRGGRTDFTDNHED